MTQYPMFPGWKEPAVSKENVRPYNSQTKKLLKLRDRILDLYKGGFVGTADDAGDQLGVSYFACRPRCSELVKQGKLVKSYIRKPKRGASKWVLKVAP